MLVQIKLQQNTRNVHIMNFIILGLCIVKFLLHSMFENVIVDAEWKNIVETNRAP